MTYGTIQQLADQLTKLAADQAKAGTIPPVLAIVNGTTGQYRLVVQAA